MNDILELLIKQGYICDWGSPNCSECPFKLSRYCTPKDIKAIVDRYYTELFLAGEKEDKDLFDRIVYEYGEQMKQSAAQSGKK